MKKKKERVRTKDEKLEEKISRFVCPLCEVVIEHEFKCPKCGAERHETLRGEVIWMKNNRIIKLRPKEV